MKHEKNSETLEIKISPELLYKISYVAQKEGRSLNNQFLLMARSSVDYYERVHERIVFHPEAAAPEKENKKEDI